MKFNWRNLKYLTAIIPTIFTIKLIYQNYLAFLQNSDIEQSINRATSGYVWTAGYGLELRLMMALMLILSIIVAFSVAVISINKTKFLLGLTIIAYIISIPSVIFAFSSNADLVRRNEFNKQSDDNYQEKSKLESAVRSCGCNVCVDKTTKSNPEYKPLIIKDYYKLQPDIEGYEPPPFPSGDQ